MGRDHPFEVAIFGVVQPNEKHWEMSVVLYAAKGIIHLSIMACSRRDN